MRSSLAVLRVPAARSFASGGALLLALIAACHPTPAKLSLPDPGRAKTAIYIATGEGRDPLLYISDLARAPGFPEIARLPGNNVELFVVYYDCPPDILRLPTGLVPIVEDGHPIPGGRAAYRAIISDEGQSPWVKIHHPPIASSLKIAREIKCGTFDLTKIELVGTEDSFAVWSYPISEDEVLVSVPDRGFYRVSATGYEELPDLRELPAFAFHAEREDRVWIYGNRNTLAVGDPKTGVFDPMPSFEDDRDPRFRAWLVGSTADAPDFELFTFHDRGVIARFDGSSWTKLYQGPGQGRGLGIFGGLLWFGPGDAIAVWENFDDPLRVITATVTVEEALPEESGDRYSVAANIPSLGPYAGTKAGRSYVREDDGTWTLYPEAPIEAQVAPFFEPFIYKISAVALLDDGVLIGGALGRFTQLQPQMARNDKYCHYEHDNELAVENLVPANQFAGSFVSDIQPFGCGYVFLSSVGFGGNVEVGFLKRK